MYFYLSTNYLGMRKGACPVAEQLDKGMVKKHGLGKPKQSNRL